MAACLPATAALRGRVSLSAAAAALLVARTLAFVPGGVVKIPHVQVPSAIFKRADGRARFPDGRSGMVPVRRRAQSPAMAIEYTDVGRLTRLMPMPEYVRLFDDGAATRDRRVQATKILSEWSETAAAQAAKAIKDNDVATRERMESTQTVIKGVADDISSDKPPDFVYALKTGTGDDEEVMALATVKTFREADLFTIALFPDEDFHLYGLEIVSLIVSPSAPEPRGTGSVFFRRLLEAGASKDYTMAANVDDALAKYYRSLKFKVIEMPGSQASLAFGGYGDESSLRADEFAVVQLASM